MLPFSKYLNCFNKKQQSINSADEQTLDYKQKELWMWFCICACVKNCPQTPLWMMCPLVLTETLHLKQLIKVTHTHFKQTKKCCKIEPWINAHTSPTICRRTWLSDEWVCLNLHLQLYYTHSLTLPLKINYCEHNDQQETSTRQNTSNKRLNRFTSLWVPESIKVKVKKHDEKIHTIKFINETQAKYISA